MPYKTNSDLPKAVKHSLSQEAQTIWRKIANSAIAQYGDENRAFATAWAGLRRAGFDKVDGIWSKVKKSDQTNVNFKVLKSNEDKMLCFGWAVLSKDKDGTEVVDTQMDCITPDDLEALAYRHVLLYRNSGEMHVGTGGKGILIESVVTTLEKQSVWGITQNFIPIGWWIGIKVLDKNVWDKVKNGTYQAFSIQGDSLREEV